VRRRAEEERARLFRRERVRDGRRTTKGETAEPGRLHRVRCQAPDRSEEERGDVDRRADQGDVLASELVQRAAYDERGAVVERVRERGGRLDQVDAELEALKEGRGGCGRVDR
jgi:hypothetical protein